MNECKIDKKLGGIMGGWTSKVGTSHEALQRGIRF